MQLTLGSPRTDGPAAQTVGQELWGDGVEHLTGDGHAQRGQIDKQLPGGAQPLVDLEGIVNVRIVDQTFPPDGGAGLLEVGAHDDLKGRGVLLAEGKEFAGIGEGGGGIVDGAGADDDEEAVVWISILDYVGDGVAGIYDGGFGFGRLEDLMLEEVGWGERIDAADCKEDKSIDVLLAV